jgi:hypothetical protein
MAPPPDPHAACRLHDQAVGGGNFRGALRSVHRGSLHVRAEHYRESRSEADAGLFMARLLSLIFTRCLFSGQIPQLIGDGCSHWLNLAHLATSNASCHADDDRVTRTKAFKPEVQPEARARVLTGIDTLPGRSQSWYVASYHSKSVIKV